MVYSGNKVEVHHFLYETMPRKTIQERFWSKVAKGSDDECWEWQACCYGGGYGQFWTDGKMKLAHRVGYLLANGPFDEKLSVCHTCDNPKCVNPGHLFLGTHQDNMKDRDSKGRQRASNLRGSDNSQSKLTEEEVKEIKKFHVKGSRTGPGSTRELSKKYGVNSETIRLIIRGVTWKHVK